MKKIVIIGGHGDGVVFLSMIEDMKKAGHDLEVMGFLNDHLKVGDRIADIPVIGNLSEASRLLFDPDIFFVNAILKVKEAYSRVRKVELLGVPYERFLTLLHPTATVSKMAKICSGVFAAPHVNIMPNAIIGENSSLRASANIGHDCHIGKFCYVGPNSTLSGRVRLEDGVHIGPNSCVLEGVTVGQYAVIGMGSVVLENVPAFSIAYGNPAKIRGEVEVAKK